MADVDTNSWCTEKVASQRLMALGDSAMLIRFAGQLTDAANLRAIAVAALLHRSPIRGVIEVVPSLVSVLIRYDPGMIKFDDLSGEVRLALSAPQSPETGPVHNHDIFVQFGGDAGPDLDEVATRLGMQPDEFIRAHNASPLRVLTTGFAPGFVYCGMHPEALRVPRRESLHASVAEGSVLFAAGQTAVTATRIRTGWHVIGKTDFRNFQPDESPPTKLQAGDNLCFCSI